MIILFAFILEVDSGLLRYRFIIKCIAPIIIAESLVLPQYAYKEYSIRAE